MKAKLNIPKKFSMGGQEITVRVMKNIEKEGAIGLYRPLHNDIQIQTQVDKEDIHPSQTELIFWHEFSHCLLSACRREDLSENEELVDLMAEFLYQSVGKNKW